MGTFFYLLFYHFSSGDICLGKQNSKSYLLTKRSLPRQTYYIGEKVKAMYRDLQRSKGTVSKLIELFSTLIYITNQK